jgi:hypothetical protein
MYTQPLFLDHELQFQGEEKLAGTLTRLSDNTDMWSQEIMQEAYKQLPYLSHFEASVALDKVDEERGYAHGSIVVQPKTALTVEEQDRSPVEKVHIPIFVRDQMLAPLDIFLKGKRYQHITEGRLRASLFRPEMFDAVRRRPLEPSIINELRPPLDDVGGSSKMGSAELLAVPLLPQLQGRVRQDHADRLKQAMADPAMMSTVSNGDSGVIAAFDSALSLAPTDREKTAQVLADRTRPNVIQLQKLANGNVLVKWANTEMFAPQVEEVPESVAQDMAGEEDIRPQLESNGTITASPDAAVKKTLESEEVKVADSFGLWKVQDVNGNTMIGWVFPKVMTLDLTPLPLSLFNNGSQYALQEHIAGEMAGKSTDIPKGVPKGYGALYYIDHGTARALVPLRVTSSYRDPNGTVKYMGDTDLGDKVMFSFVDGLKTVAKVGPGEYAIPASFSWMPLRGDCELVSEPLSFSKVAVARWQQHAELVGDGDVFSFRGPAVAKIKEAHTKFIDRPKAEFMGAALGLHPVFCKEALDRASRGERIALKGVRQITPLSEKLATARSNIQKELDELDPPIHNYFLAKEAAVLDDALTADKILGLGFLNAENVSAFVDMLPALDATSSKLAELLFAIRIGLKEVPEVAVERMLVALEDVIQGLKALQQKEVSFSN